MKKCLKIPRLACRVIHYLSKLDVKLPAYKAGSFPARKPKIHEQGE
jgi:hypothetical protein